MSQTNLFSFDLSSMFFFLFFSLYTRSFSLVDAFDALILRVKWRFEVGLGLVHHSHPFQGKLATFDEICTHLMKEKNSRSQS